MYRILFLFLVALSSNLVSAQSLKPGFDKEEYIGLMKVSSQFGDSAYAAKLPPPKGFRFVYRSPAVGLVNMYDIYMSDKNIPIISIRGTIGDPISWMANFYAAMVPARGEIQLSKDYRFKYQMAENPRAAIHVGWLVSTGFLVKDMMPKIDSLYKAGHKEMLIMGHSQGGAIGFLLTAYLLNLQKQQLLAPDIRFKTYCSAGPKPGNLYFAHEYEALTQFGWAYNVVNSADWVPESPVTIQTEGDFNQLNPFADAKPFIRKQGLFKRLGLSYAYGRLTKPNRKGVKNYQKFLGRYVAKSIRKHLPGFVEPAYSWSNDYVRTGNQITLLADEDYFKAFPQDTKNVFTNHLHPAYLYLINQYPKSVMSKNSKVSLNGKWELRFLVNQKTPFAELYPDRKPFLNLSDENTKFNGNTGCNTINGNAVIEGNRINFPEAMAMTRMMCPGEGENAFLSTLKKVNGYSLNGETLTLLMGDIALMRFERVWL
ncbi:MAG: META domain-containing protein [Chitinophagaceae bacterium]